MAVDAGASLKRIGEARALYFGAGVTPVGLVDEAISRSWSRCASADRRADERLSFDAVTRASLGSGVFIWSAAMTGVCRTQPLMRSRAASTSEMPIIVFASELGVVGRGDHQAAIARRHPPGLAAAV